MAYLRGEQFSCSHPPLAKLLIAGSVLIFGDHPWSWRVPNACLGCVLVAVTYLLARRMFGSRLAAAFAATLVLCDGMFLVHSRMAVTDIVYLTFAAIGYLMLFQFVQATNLAAQRRALIFAGVWLGLSLASKFFIPGVAFLLVIAFLTLSLVPMAGRPDAAEIASRPIGRQIAGAIILVGSVSASVYLVTFLPHFMFGWWSGVGSLFHYSQEAVWRQRRTVAGPTDPYASPLWSWPLMLHPYRYFQETAADGRIATVWGGGNPLSWWAASVAIAITAAKTVVRPTFAPAFLVVGYLSFWLVLIASPRRLYLYFFMASVYFGYLALGELLAECWRGEASRAQQVALLLAIVPGLVLGVDAKLGFVSYLVLGGTYTFLQSGRQSGIFVCLLLLAATLAAFVYFFPIWTAMPLEPEAFSARMWLAGPGLANWNAGS